MKCSAVRPWLFGAEASAGLPANVARHLQRCARCRARRELLGAVEFVTGGELIPSPSPEARARLLARLEKEPAPRPAAVLAGPRPRRFPWVRVAAALLLTFAAGWLVRSLGERGGTGPVIVTVPAAVPRSEEMLVARFLERDLRLARTEAPDERLQVLSDMAADLRSEAIHLAQHGPLGALPPVTQLYEQVVRRGMARCALLLPAQRRPLVLAAVRQLEEADAEVERVAADLPPPAAALLRPIGVASREARRRIDSGEKPVETDQMTGPSDDLDTQRTLLTVLVMQGLRLAEEEDPRTRAEYARDLTELENLLTEAGRVLDGVERDRAARGSAGQRQPLTPDEREKVKDLEKSVKDLEKTLKKMKENKEPPRPGKKPPGHEKGKEGKGREREKDDD
jgi:hypothetical protein